MHAMQATRLRTAMGDRRWRMLWASKYGTARKLKRDGSGAASIPDLD
jgi:hypothetical protein